MRGPDHLTTNCGVHVLTAGTAATGLINIMAEDTATVVGGASVRDMRAESTIAVCTLLSMCCLCAYAGRLRVLPRVRASSWAQSNQLLILRTEPCGSHAPGAAVRSAIPICVGLAAAG